MSTPGNPLGSTAGNVLSTLTGVDGAITLALNIGGVLVPLVKGLILEIKQIASGSETVTYQVLIQADQAELAQVISLSTDDLNAVNAELQRLGAPTLPFQSTPDPGNAAK